MPIQEARLPSIFVVPLVQVFLGVFFFISLLYGFRDLILFTGILLGIGFGANIWCRMSPQRLGCDLSVDRRRVFPGEKLELRVRAVNAKFLPVLLRIALPFDRSMTGPDQEDAGISMGMRASLVSGFEYSEGTGPPPPRGLSFGAAEPGSRRSPGLLQQGNEDPCLRGYHRLPAPR